MNAVSIDNTARAAGDGSTVVLTWIFGNLIEPSLFFAEKRQEPVCPIFRMERECSTDGKALTDLITTTHEHLHS
ncbi:unnamed protein product, partial [Iphiclides podalirius]